MALDRSVTCIGYVRVSTERQAGETFTSMADQEAAIRAKAAGMGLSVSRIYRDEGISGSTAEKRPGFMEMIAECKASPRSKRAPGTIILLNDSRFGRWDDAEEAAHWRWLLRQHGWQVRYCEGDVEDGTYRPAVLMLNSTQSSEYRSRIRANSRRGLQSTAVQGFWGREAPFGYVRVVAYPPESSGRVLPRGVQKARTERVSLMPEEKVEAPLVRWLFEQYADGRLSLGTAVHAMREKARGRKWSRTAVGGVLRNPVYLGKVVGGRRQRDDGSPVTEYGKEGAHPPIISPDLFARVQARLAQNRKEKRARSSGYALTGLVHCAHCGIRLVGGGGVGFKFYREYIPDVGVRECPGKVGTVGRDILEFAVVNTVAKEIARPRVQAEIVSAVDYWLSRDSASTPARLTALTNELKTLAAKRDRLVELMADGTVTRAEGSGRLSEIRATIAAMESERDGLRFGSARVKAIGDERDRIVKAALDFPRQVRLCSGRELRDLLRPWIQSAVFDKQRRVLTLEIRRVPALGALPMDSLGEPDGHGKGRRLTVRREIDLRQPHPGRRVRRTA